MQQKDVRIIEQLAKSAVAGAFAGMAIMGFMLWFDVSSIGVMFNEAQNPLLANIFLAGAMLKGALLGAAFGSARLNPHHDVAVRTSSRPGPAQPARA